MKTFEYTTKYLRVWPLPDVTLGEMGIHGWELVSVITDKTGDAAYYYFKRELPSDTHSYSGPK